MFFVEKTQRSQSKNVNKIISYEKKINLDNSEFCKKFKNNCEISKKNLKKN